MALKPVVVGEEFALGPITLNRTEIATIPVEDYNKNGAVLVNSRIKAYIHMPVDGHDEPQPVEFTLSLYIQRGAISDDEAKRVAALGVEQKAKKDERDKADQDKLAREKRMAFDLGQQATMSALKNIGELAQGVAALSRLGGGK